MREYLSETYGNKFAAHISPAQGSPKPLPAASPGVRAGHVLSSSAGNSAPNSPMAMLHIGSNPEREVRHLEGPPAWLGEICAYVKDEMKVSASLGGGHSPILRKPQCEETQPCFQRAPVSQNVTLVC